jgi:NhaC family Na+:H+ antiporter
MSEEGKVQNRINPPTLLDALIPIIFLIVLLASAVYLYGADGIGGPIQVALMLSMMIAGLIGLKNGHKWAEMGKAAVDGISQAMGPYSSCSESGL